MQKKIDLSGRGMNQNDSDSDERTPAELLAEAKSNLTDQIFAMGDDVHSKFWEEEEGEALTKDQAVKEVNSYTSTAMCEYILKEMVKFNDKHEESGESDSSSDSDSSYDYNRKEDISDQDSSDFDEDSNSSNSDSDTDNSSDSDGDSSDGGDDSEAEESEESEESGDGEQEPDLEQRVAELERWRGEEIDPAMGKSTETAGTQSETENSFEIPPPSEETAKESSSISDETLKMMFADAKESTDDKNSYQMEGEVLPEWFKRAAGLVRGGVYMLWQGPSGCGKTHTANLLAKFFNRPFGAHSCSENMHSGDLSGMLVPVESGGNFIHVPSLFLDMCQDPGVFLWDELDAADSNFLVGFNMMLAQRELYIPSRRLTTLPQFDLQDILEEFDSKYSTQVKIDKIGHSEIRSLSDLRKLIGKRAYKILDNSFSVVKLHPEFYILGAANTFGHGADMVYAGRNQLDGATLDRFKLGTFKLNYSEKVEKKILRSDVFMWGTAMRRALEVLRMDRRLLTTRFLVDCNKMVTAGWTLDECAEGYYMDWSADDVLRHKSAHQNCLIEICKDMAA